MIRNLKVSGAMLAAVLALSAFAAGSASAAEFHSEVEPTTIQMTATSSHVIKTGIVQFGCLSANWQGILSTKTSGTLSVTPGYGLCHAIVFGSTTQASINLNGCGYDLSANGSFAIKCPVGKSIELKGGFCTVLIPAQTVESVGFVNSGKRIDATLGISGISYSHTGFSCGTGSGTEGTYAGGSTIVGKNSGGTEIKIWHE